MKASIIKVAGLLIVVAALSAPVASAKPYVDSPAQDQGIQVSPPASSSLNTPAQDQGMQATVTPNDRAGTQGIGQTSVDSIGMGGQYGANLIKASQSSKQRDLQTAKTFTLPLAPDDRPGTAAVAPALVVPYLSHGRGVSVAQFNGSPTAFTTPVATPGNGFNWGSAGIGAAGLAAIALLIGLLVVLGRRSRHEGVAVS